MKSVGIMTYHNHYNYGTMLQAYALQHYISTLGYRAEIIDFKQSNILSGTELIKLRIRRIPAYLLRFREYAVVATSRKKIIYKYKLFEEFYKKYIVIGAEHYSSTIELIENPPQYDGYVVGSDQTWNPNASGGPEAFFLPFVKNNEKKGSYAPSIGVASLTKEQENKIKNHLKKIDFLSCREVQGAKLLESILGKKVFCHIDPTLLLSSNQWDSIAAPIDIQKPYILTYFLGSVKKHRNFVKRLSEKTGYNVVSIPVSFLEMRNKKWTQQWCGPDKFLSLIKNASFICTDSFHGTAFSINYNIPFFTFCKTDDSKRESENSRLYSVLEMFGLSDRLVRDQMLLDNLDVDFTNANRVLEQKRKESNDYLKKMLDSITR